MDRNNKKKFLKYQKDSLNNYCSKLLADSPTHKWVSQNLTLNYFLNLKAQISVESHVPQQMVPSTYGFPAHAAGKRLQARVDRFMPFQP